MYRIEAGKHLLCIARRALRRTLVPLLLASTLFSLCPVVVMAEDSEPVGPDPVVLQADPAGVVLEWRAPSLSQRRVTGGDGRSYVALDAPGWEYTQVAGQPRLPVASALIVVPPTGDVELRVEVLAYEQHLLPHPIAPSPRLIPVGSPVTGLGWTWARDPSSYTDANLHPLFSARSGKKDAISLEEVGWLRGRRLMRLTFIPMHFDPARSMYGRIEGPALEVARRVRVEIRFQDSARAEGILGSDDPFGATLRNIVVNPAQVDQFVHWGQTVPAGLVSDGSMDSMGGPESAQDTQADLTSVAPPTDTEYLIITHSDFITAVAPLAARRAISDGLKVFSTTVQVVYDAYSGGVVAATAIRDYISDTYHNPAVPALTYVLLVGDGTRSDVGDQYIPPFVITMDPTWRPDGMDPWPAASDNRFVTVDGSDNLADVFIGRLPVNSVAEAVTVVEKILTYELTVPQWPWNERVLFFAGNEDPGQGETFHADSDWLYTTLPVTYTGQRVYFCSDQCTLPYQYQDVTVAHDGTLYELNFGGLLASYIGHSSWHQWAVDPVTFAPMFHVDHVVHLHNGGMLPVVLEMTCYTSDFSYPDSDTFDESLLRHADGGAVATWGSTTLGVTVGHGVLHREFFDQVFEQSTTELGPATAAAKVELAGRAPQYLDLLDTFLLLGDPAMNLNTTTVGWDHRVLLPAALRSWSSSAR